MKSKVYNYGQQFIDNEDIKAVNKVLCGKYLTTGPYVEKFEKKAQKYFKSKYAISCNSGTSAIYLALKSINLKKGDNVIIPSINFVAAANITKILGANVYFADVDNTTFQLSKNSLLRCIKFHKLKRIKVVFTMHLGGSAMHQKEIFKLKNKYNYSIIEDACHALGGRYVESNLIVGSCAYSDITTFSLHPVKTITSGEGGIITTNNKKIAQNILELRSHGIHKKKDYTYQITKNSLNFRLSDLNLALAYSQLMKVKLFVDKRKSLAERYYTNFKQISNYLEVINFNNKNNSAWHLLIIKIDKEKLRKFNYLNFYKQLKAKKIFCQLHYIPTYRFSAFKKNILKYKKICKNSEFYFKNCISLPIYYKLKFNDIDHISKIVIKILRAYET